jgi:hypothetical protein
MNSGKARSLIVPFMPTVDLHQRARQEQGHDGQGGRDRSKPGTSAISRPRPLSIRHFSLRSSTGTLGATAEHLVQSSDNTLRDL